MNDQFDWMLFRARCSQAFSFKYRGCEALALNFNFFMEGSNETGSAISLQSGDSEIRILVKHCTNEGFPQVALRNTCYHPFESAKLVENTDEAWLRFLSQCVAFAWDLFEIESHEFQFQDHQEEKDMIDPELPLPRIIRADNVSEYATWLGVSPEICSSLNFYDCMGTQLENIISVNIDTGEFTVPAMSRSGSGSKIVYDSHDWACEIVQVTATFKLRLFEIHGERGWYKKFTF